MIPKEIFKTSPKGEIRRNRFSEPAESELVVVGTYRQAGREVKLRADAARALHDLMAQARNDSVAIIPISGFRTVAYQERLFQKAVAKYGSEDAAVRWVGRPGHSEHHTGLVVDLGEEDSPACDVEPPFENTRAFQWLQKNAARFGFELSYPRNNPRGVHFEPWHWRFVGTPEAKQVFQK
ncbi:MAG TPA: M15 family metallopeptidase [Candidatus Acidoferrum sp.]|nr:M15 family metallopeptidase [Candidatus Acidoferrum sp.]